MKFAFTLAALALTAAPVLADEMTLTAPMSSATLHEGGLDMNVYFVEAENGYDVIGTYVSRVGAYAPARIRMLMQDGDSVAFGMPGARDVLYSFERSGDALHVTAENTGLQFASN
ncbi:MAG: hypothetical protein ACKVKF_00030 [Rhodobacterales bacterium]|nr:hypothetical protein [Puniceibacterium antarcticum]